MKNIIIASTSTLHGSSYLEYILEDLKEFFKDASEILFSARYKEVLDWDTIDTLTMNSDFKEFLTRVKKDIQNNGFYDCASFYSYSNCNL